MSYFRLIVCIKVNDITWNCVLFKTCSQVDRPIKRNVNLNASIILLVRIVSCIEPES